MASIFMLYVETVDEGPLFLGFFTTLQLAASRGEKIVDDKLGFASTDLFIYEYALDQMLNVYAGAGYKQLVESVHPEAVYNYKGDKIR